MKKLFEIENAKCSDTIFNAIDMICTSLEFKLKQISMFNVYNVIFIDKCAFKSVTKTNIKSNNLEDSNEYNKLS